MAGIEFEDQSHTIGDMQYMLRAWGDPAASPVLALHGWMDNCASYDVLAPLLAEGSGHYVVAVELAGQGHTSHRPHSGGYQIWSDLVDLLLLSEKLGWSQFHVMGHSRGAMIASLLAATLNEMVSGLVVLDGFLPQPLPFDQAAEQLRRHVFDELRYFSWPDDKRVLGSVEEAVRLRLRMMPMSEASARRIVERGLREVEGGFEWRHDDRLKHASAFKLSAEHCVSVIEALTMPGLAIWTNDRIESDAEQLGLLTNIPNMRLEPVQGMHHFHMEDEAVYAAELISDFLRSNN